VEPSPRGRSEPAAQCLLVNDSGACDVRTAILARAHGGVTRADRRVTQREPPTRGYDSARRDNGNRKYLQSDAFRSRENTSEYPVSGVIPGYSWPIRGHLRAASEAALTPSARLPEGAGGAGSVAELGAGVTGWEEGQPAAVYLSWGCGRCRACAEGADQYCEAFPRGTVPAAGIGYPGGMAEMVSVSVRHLVELKGSRSRPGGPAD